MNRTKKFLYNSMSTALYQVIVMIAGFITPRFMLLHYGSEINGLVSSINQFITYFNLVEAGLGSAAVYSLYKPLADGDHKRINAIVSAAKHFYYVSGAIFVVLVAVLAAVYPSFAKVENLSYIAVSFLVIVLSSKSFLDFFSLAKYRVILTADQKTYVISLAASVHMILNTLVIVVLSMKDVNVLILYTIAIIPLIVRTIILEVYVKKNYKYLNYNEERDDSALDKRWDALFLQIVQAVQVGAPTVIATVFTSLKTVSVYSIFNMVMNGINSVLNIFQNGLSASFGDLIARNEKDKLQKAYNEFEYAYYHLIFLIYTIAAIMLQYFVNIYTSRVTDVNYNQPILAYLFVLNGIMYNLKTPQGMLVIAAGLYRETRWQSLTQTLIAIVFGIALAIPFGLYGIMTALILSNLYRVIDLLFFIPKYVTHLKVSSSIVRIIRLLLTVSVCFIPSIFLNINVTNFLSWAIYAIIYTLFVVLVLLIESFIFERSSLISLLKRIKNTIKK